MEEIIVSDIVVNPITIKNKSEIITSLKEVLKKYNIVLTEENIKDGKEARAELNKVKKVIEDKRKEIKELILQPYEVVKKDFDEITQLIEEVSNRLDVQVKEFENITKEEKRQAINKLLEKNITGVEIFNERWLNATYKINDIKEEIDNFIENFNNDMELLKNEDSYIKDYYKKCRNISQTLMEKKRLEELKKQDEKQEEVVVTYESETTIEVEDDEEIEVNVEITLKVDVTKAELLKLKEFLVKNNYTYKLIGGLE